MRRRSHDSHEEDTGKSDTFLNALVIFMFLMFLYMCNQGVQSMASNANETLLNELLNLQEETLNDAAKRAEAFAKAQKSAQQSSEQERKRLLDRAAEVTEKSREQQAKAEAKEEAMNSQIDQLNENIAKMRDSQSLRLDVSHDLTGSMTARVPETRSTLQSITKTLPRVITSLEIGFIGYRDGKLDQIPIEAVRKSELDAGASIRRVQNALGRIEAKGGVANIEQAIRTSMTRFDSMPGSPRELLVVIGDVSTVEVKDVDASLISDVKRWCNTANKNRRVLAVFTGATASKHEKFYRALGQANEESKFSTSTASLYEQIINAAF